MALDFINYKELQQKRMSEVQYSIKNMSTLVTANTAENANKYERFTKVIALKIYNNFPVEAVENSEYVLPEDWFTLALKGKMSELPKVKDQEMLLNGLSPKEETYKNLMPYYRALADDYKGRSIFQWVFNHKEYVAVRDAYKAVGNLIKGMTGDEQKALDSVYREHKQDIEEANEIHSIIKGSVKNSAKTQEEKNQIKDLEKGGVLQRAAAISKNKEYRKHVKEIIKEAVKNYPAFEGKPDKTLEALIDHVQIKMQEYSLNKGALANGIFDAVAMVYLGENVDAKQLASIQIVADQLMEKIVQPNNVGAVAAYKGNALKLKTDIAGRFNVSTGVIEQAKKEYGEMTNQNEVQSEEGREKIFIAIQEENAEKVSQPIQKEEDAIKEKLISNKK